MEISSLATYVLIALGKDRRALLASYRYLILGTIGATFFVLGVGIIYVLTGTLNFTEITEKLKDVETALFLNSQPFNFFKLSFIWLSFKRLINSPPI